MPVLAEAIAPPDQNTEQLLTLHWAMDSMAAKTLADSLSNTEHIQLYEAVRDIDVDTNAIAAREQYRREIGDIVTGKLDKELVIVGPCSLDSETNYSEFFDQVEELQRAHPNARIVVRLNKAKPRTGGKWRGLEYSTELEDRETAYDVFKEAFHRQIPIITEITDKDELGATAPYLSAAWLGARDMTSSSLRATCSLIHLPILTKNHTDGQAETVENTIAAIGMNTEDYEGSGVNIVIAATPAGKGIITGILPVGEGNSRVGIIARGYELKEDLNKEERRRKVIQHLGELCALAARLDTVVIVDGSHSIATMLGYSKKDPERLPHVIDTILDALSKGEIVHGERVAGIMGETGPSEGRTDPNWLSTAKNIGQLSGLIIQFTNIRDQLLEQSAA